MKKFIGLLCVVFFVCVVLVGSREDSAEEKLKKSQEALDKKYSELLGGLGEYKKGVDEASGITEYTIDASSISQSTFDMLKNGMSYDEAMETLGAKINPAASNDDFFMCNWNGPDDAFIIINFTEKKLSFSTASNLPTA